MSGRKAGRGTVLEAVVLADRTKNEVRILVVERESVVRLDIEDCLSRAGYTVSATRCGEDAVALATAQQPQVVLIDMSLAVARDFEDRFGALIVYLVTDPIPEARARRPELQSGRFIRKPFQEGDLLRAVEDAVFHRNSVRQARPGANLSHPTTTHRKENHHGNRSRHKET